MQLSALPKHTLPREKLLKKGPHALSDAELLAIFLRTGIAGMNAIELAESLLTQSRSLQNLFNASLKEFSALKGLGEAKYVQLQAVLELSKRYMREACLRDTVFTSPDAVNDYLCLQLKGLEHEVFMALYLDNQNQLIHDEILFNGTINAASVYPREVVKAALKHNAASLIFAHNHPSGIAEPSEADKLITQKLQKALALVDIHVLDHLIVAGNRCISFAQRGLI
ncbi:MULTISPECIES: RadC family protein [Pseudoalteromonas]|uniref:Associated with replication fork DNA repair protein n=1 Tax=Pseudoalteromonas phenolica TaxID=161398 RepID=A0A0S2JXR9_9GAMM|nr:DNA repair protein RadC [Pseudoalteromonas phenolica]ALO40774.1 Associated with replication fork DNA repair protein [Pseudoalteromonas phenolica]MBE0354707.1 DNA repair protein RadC [Pseudoalteromonas phenolica O-BC30]TLX46909.1 JAB domain-containing protein [Pseudoalteromonas phenolica]TMO52569.1 JAB domain-containing protein [Pseudoalteromonas phenolica]|tara:strand:- start:631 stop:1305 length:675 start_codon:yes stop_codon:yes gene_type:complete